MCNFANWREGAKSFKKLLCRENRIPVFSRRSIIEAKAQLPARIFKTGVF